MSFALFLLYIAFSFLRPVEMYLLEWASYRPMLVLWCAAAVGAAIRSSAISRVGGKPLHFWLMVAFTIATFAAHLTSGYLGGVTSALSNFSASSMLYVLVLLNATDTTRIRATCVTMLLSMIALSVLVIASYHTGYQSKNLVLWQATGAEYSDDGPIDLETAVPAQVESERYMIRLHGLGFLSDPNDFAQAIVMVFPLLGLWYLPGRFLRNSVTVFAPAGLMLYAIFLTHSRGALLGLLALLFFGVRKRLGNTKTMILVAIIAIAPSLAQFGGGRAMSTKEESASQRIEAWYEGFQMLRSNPLFGVGFGNFVDNHYLTAHNSFVLCFAELGLFGYFCWLALLVVSYQGLARVIDHAAQDSQEHALANMLRSSMIGFLACAWFLSRTYQPGLYIMLAVCMAMWRCSEAVVSKASWRAYADPLPWVSGTFKLMFVTLAMVYAFILLGR